MCMFYWCFLYPTFSDIMFCKPATIEWIFPYTIWQSSPYNTPSRSCNNDLRRGARLEWINPIESWLIWITKLLNLPHAGGIFFKSLAQIRGFTGENRRTGTIKIWRACAYMYGKTCRANLRPFMMQTRGVEGDHHSLIHTPWNMW